MSPEFAAVDRMAFAAYEMRPYQDIEQSLYADVSGFFDGRSSTAATPALRSRP